MRCADPASLHPGRLKPWIGALSLSLLAHATLLTPTVPALPAMPSATPALSTRLLLSQAPAVPPPPQPRPAAAPAPRAAPAVARPVLPPSTAASPAAPAATVVLPPPGEWTYQLRQRGQQGTARLSWQPQAGGGYRLSLARELAGRALPGWQSLGQLDGLGLAPQRFSEQRRGRDSSATNFRRDEGVISFSASPALVALPAGVQDRLSWWLQLAARVDAAPERFLAGSEIRLSVAGLRGEAREWVFEVLGRAPLTLADGAVLAEALHLRRGLLGPYDGGIEVWLDPARGHLPVRLLLGLQEEQGWELLLWPSEPGQ